MNGEVSQAGGLGNMVKTKSYRRIGAAEWEAVEGVVESLLSAFHVGNAVRDIITRGNAPTATAFERYAAKLLRDAGGLKLARVQQSGVLKVLAPEDGQLAKIVYSGGFPKGSLSTLLSVECAVNRLVCIRDAIADGIDESEPQNTKPRKSISILGGGYLSNPNGWRSAHVKLPPLDAGADVTPAYYHEIDWRSTDCVASNARAVFQRSMRPNPYRNNKDVNVADKSDWDVRTRLAQILRALELPHRYSFRFDYDMLTRTVEVAFTCPPPEFLPTVLPTNSDSALISIAEALPTNNNAASSPSHADAESAGCDDVPLDSQVEVLSLRDSHTHPSCTEAQHDESGDASLIARAHEAYLLRLACLMGAACFGSGRAIDAAIVTGYNASWKQALVSAHFTRDDFVRSVLMAVDSGEMARPDLRFEPHRIAEMISATHLDWLGRLSNDERSSVTLPQMSVTALRKETWEDERALTKEAQEIFHSKRICDIDTAHYYGGSGDAVDAARNDAGDSNLAAIARLESLVAELEQQTVPPDDDASSRPVFAANALARLALALVHDDMDIASQAEAFLHEQAGSASSKQAKGPSFFRAPDALYYAHFGLSDLYQRMGDFHGALLHADRCLALAPSTASAFCRKADILSEQKLLTQAANVLMAGLQCCASSIDAALLYFHLGVTFWELGMLHEAAVVHAYNSSLKGEYAILSSRALQELRRAHDVHDKEPTAPFKASQELKRLNIPLAPVKMPNLIAQATVSLANSGSPLAAAPYATELERLSNNDEIIIAACQSIQFGVVR